MMEKGNRATDLDKDNSKEGLPELIGQSFASLAGYSRHNGYSRIRDDAGGLGGIVSRYDNIDSLEIPYDNNGGLYSTSRAITLCRKAYIHVPVFKTAIDIMTDLSNTEIHLEGGNTQSNKFFSYWLKRIRDHHLKNQFFKECYLSGNIIFHRVDSVLTPSDALKLSQTYAKKIDIPTRYILLDPSRIWMGGFASGQPTYHRVLSPFEMNQLKNSGNKDDKEVYLSLRQEILKFDKRAIVNDTVIEMDGSRIHAIFYQKQDYEPMAIPMGYCVLDDINLQLELKKCDSILAQTVEYIILLVTMGDKDTPVTTRQIEGLKSTFKNEKVGRVLVSDYTTKAEFVIPDLDKILSPVKYEEVNRNIASGLMNIFFGEQKYADSMTKLRALIKKIENAQELFLNSFLQPEIKRISKEMGFKSYPIAKFEPIRIEDQTNMMRVYAQLAQLGILTPKDTIETIDTGLLPNYNNLELNQEDFRTKRDKGLFEPVVGGPYTQQKLAKEQAREAAKQKIQGAPSPSAPSGRPAGSKAPQKTKKVSQVGASEGDSFSQKSVIEYTGLYDRIEEEMPKIYKQERGVKRVSSTDKQTIASILNILTQNEKPEEWLSKASSYVKDIPEFNPEISLEISRIEEEYEVPRSTAVVLYHSKINN